MERNSTQIEGARFCLAPLLPVDCGKDNLFSHGKERIVYSGNEERSGENPVSFCFPITAQKGAERMEKQRFGEGLREALSQEVWEEEKREQLRAMGYRGTWIDLLFQAQVERAAKGDATAFRLLRDAMAEAAEEEKSRALTGEDLRQMSDEELWALLERCREDGGE